MAIKKVSKAEMEATKSQQEDEGSKFSWKSFVGEEVEASAAGTILKGKVHVLDGDGKAVELGDLVEVKPDQEMTVVHTKHGPVEISVDEANMVAQSAETPADEAKKAAADFEQALAQTIDSLEEKVAAGNKAMLQGTAPPKVTETVLKPATNEQVSDYHLEDPVAPKVIPAHELANVSVNLGMSINLGNYNNAKVGVVITMPTSTKDIDATYNFAREWAENRIQELADGVFEDHKIELPDTGAEPPF